MELLFILLVIGAIVVGILSYVIWIVFFVWAVKKGIESLQADMTRAQQLLQQYQFLPPPSQAQMRPEILQLLTQANAHLQQMDSLRRQRYDLKVGELHSMAAQAGIDWTPPPY
jgi:hypothetical protein